MGRAGRLDIFAPFRDALGFIRNLLEGHRDHESRSPWLLDDLEKVLAMWPATGETRPAKPQGEEIFQYMRRLFRYGFRLSVPRDGEDDGLRLRQFFADGELYRPEGYSRESRALIAELSHLAQEKNALLPGQCRVARARPVLKALGFPDLDSPDSFAIQFAWDANERWIFIDSRPEVFRREIAAALAKKFATSHESESP